MTIVEAALHKYERHSEGAWPGPVPYPSRADPADDRSTPMAHGDRGFRYRDF
jgi:hypothetical protein